MARREEEILDEIRRARRMRYSRPDAKREARGMIEEGVEQYVEETKPPGTKIVSSPVRKGRGYRFIEPQSPIPPERALVPYKRELPAIPTERRLVIPPERRLVPVPPEERALVPYKRELPAIPTERRLAPSGERLPPGREEPLPRHIFLTVRSEPIKGEDPNNPTNAAGMVSVVIDGNNAGLTDTPPIPVAHGEHKVSVPAAVERVFKRTDGSKYTEKYEFLYWMPSIPFEKERTRAMVPSGPGEEEEIEVGGRIEVRRRRPMEYAEQYRVIGTINITEDTVLTAVYGLPGQAIHTMRPTTKGGYQPGAGGPLGGHVASELGRAAAGKWSGQWEVPHRVGLTIALNAGKRQLHAYAYGEFDRLFMPLRRRWEDKKTNLKTLEGDARQQEKEIRRIIRQEKASGGGGFLGMGGFGRERVHQIASGLLNPEAGGAHTWTGAGNQAALQRAFTIFDQWFTARENFEKDFEKDLESCSSRLRKYLEDKADIVAVRVARQQKIPLHSPDQVDLEKELKDYAGELAEDLITRGNTWFQTMMRGLGRISREMSTTQQIWQNILANLWGFIFGPWVLGTLFVLLQFFAMIAWSGGLAGGFNPLFVFVLPGVMALFLLILNIENVQMPLDFLTHIISGWIIGTSAIMLMMAIATPAAVNENFFITIVVWLFLAVFIGAFQIYQAGSFPPVFAISAVILLFFWLALGPYGNYYSMVIDQVKAPLVLAWRAIQNAFEDVWLLATNPTEWYARQQMRNVRSEKPLDYPKALEIVSFDTIPSQGIPASKLGMKMEFAATVTLQNKGRMAASDVSAQVQCNTFCNSSAEPVQAIGSMKPGEGNRIQFTKLSSWIPTPGREAEFHAAKVSVNISYRYSTNASLAATVMNEEEIKKQFAEGSDVFKPVQAIDMGTPATLSLNVGPQPLFRGKNSLLLVSVYTVRDDGYVVLDRDTRIKLRLPSSVGSRLKCSACNTSAYSITDKDNNPIESGEEALCSPPERVEIKPFEFSTTYAFLCNFEANSTVQVSKTGVIRAEMPNYEFVVLKSKDLPITPPLGIIKSEVTPGIGCDYPAVKQRKDEFERGDGSRITAELAERYGLSRNELIRIKAYVASRLWPIVLKGEVPEKIAQSAQAVGLDAEGQVIALKVAKAESNFVHCWDGTNNCGSQDPSKVKCGDNGNSCGIFQLHKGAHPDWYTPSGAAAMGCTGNQVAYDLNCNIRIGAQHIKNLYNDHYNEPPKLYTCKNVYYEKWDAVLRWYNGWPNDCSGNPNYVDVVKSQDVSGATGEGKYHLTREEADLCRSNNLDINSIDCALKVLSDALSRNSNDWSRIPVDSVFSEWVKCLTPKPTGYMWPVPSSHTITSCFGDQRNYGPHTAIDIAASEGQDVVATTDANVDAVVDCTNNCGPYGKYILLKHNDNAYYSQYSHLSGIDVSAGNYVVRGQKIGRIGSTGDATGPHLDFEIKTAPSSGYKNPCELVDCQGQCGSQPNQDFVEE